MITIYYIFLFYHLLPFITAFVTSFITICNLSTFITIYSIYYKWYFIYYHLFHLLQGQLVDEEFLSRRDHQSYLGKRVPYKHTGHTVDGIWSLNKLETQQKWNLTYKILT